MDLQDADSVDLSYERGDPNERVTESNNPEEYNSDADRMLRPNESISDEKGLILPKKITNPCSESADRKNVHRELMFNQRIGKSVLNQKSELQRALDRQRNRQFMQKENQENTSSFKGELEQTIMERAERTEKKKFLVQEQLNPEYLNARAKLRGIFDAK